ncbi:hypothetical protein F5B22DRAFT_114280 [Xylaria bambusicola]|uniref:uncharacterized protein n=1 Tax=Xylaria bambusicola TaxID=326684 RepID=UPI0020084455|nr:uncharacterized protein F5B22DRAFT_114280 [Xylaria bambusicola]KAI0517226.1 hypothetical protein F5B22DRAFT_114280 [Xylaria bambusicola]
MPPKRKSTGSNSQTNKKTKAATPPAEPKYEPPRSNRWSAVSASANAEKDYRMCWKDEEKAYSYMTLCSPSYAEEEDEDEENDKGDADNGGSENAETSDDEAVIIEGEGEDGEGTKQPRCGINCVCFKPLTANPDHPWVISDAGYSKFMNQFLHNFVRVPDLFSMYIFNDWAAYGSLEILENLYLDFEEAEKKQRGGWREQWAICEGTVHWLLHHTGQAFCMADDGERVQEASRLVGRMFLAMLAQLDEAGLVGDATAVKSLGCTMAMYMLLASNMRRLNVLKDEPRKRYTSKLKFQPDYFEDGVMAYVNRRGVTLRGPEEIEELMAAAKGDIELPKKGNKDPWGWKVALKAYTKDRGVPRYIIVGSRPKIGGDRYDVTTIPSSERKAASFTGKDPFSKKELEALKDGMILSPA